MDKWGIIVDKSKVGMEIEKGVVLVRLWGRWGEKGRNWGGKGKF